MMMDFDLDNIQQKFFLGFYFTLHITRGVGCFSIVIIIGSESLPHYLCCRSVKQPQI